jgi:CheY-like chemotaxis protein/predicted regulator of Ras-like GTPase activity (Roadblock/LC7/MglB family)
MMPKNKHNQENNRKTILIVDDEETLTWSMSKNLSMNKQYKVICANSAEEASVILQKTSHIDLIVSDIKMEGKSGFDLLDEVKTHYPQISFIIMTAYGSDENKHEALAKGALRYVEKPFGMNNMIKIIGEVLEERDQQISPQKQLKSKIMGQSLLADILTSATRDISELIFIRLNAMDGDTLYSAGTEFFPARHKDLLSSMVVNKTEEICQQLAMGESELIAISTEKHYVLLKPLPDQQIFLYFLFSKKLGLGKSLYFMERISNKIINAIKPDTPRRLKNNED